MKLQFGNYFMLKYDSDSESQRPNRKTLFHYLPYYCSQSLYRAWWILSWKNSNFVILLIRLFFVCIFMIDKKSFILGQRVFLLHDSKIENDKSTWNARQRWNRAHRWSQKTNLEWIIADCCCWSIRKCQWWHEGQSQIIKSKLQYSK